MTQAERNEQRKFLRHGDQVLLAKLANVHHNVVHRWLEGHQEFSVVEPYFIKLVEKRKQEMEERFNQI